MKRILLTIAFFAFYLSIKCQYDPTNVDTPTGIDVDALIFVGTDFDADEIITQNYNWTHIYNCVIVANSTNYYNCHGYAWHNVEGNMNQSDLRWINDRNAGFQHTFNVDKYYTGSNPAYVEVSSNYRPGLKVSYDPSDHSAMTHSTTHFISKWAYGPLCIHTPLQCPFYQNAVIKYYEFNPSLSGSESLLCYNNQRTFSMNFTNMEHATFSWTPGSYVQPVGGTDSYSLTVTGTGNGNNNVNLQFSTPSGYTWSDDRTFWVGVPIISNQRVDGSYYTYGKQICPGNHWLSVTPVGDGAGNATWTVPPGIQYLAGTNTLDFTLPYNLSSISISARSANSCGNSTNANFYLVKKPYGCGGFLLFPNPANNDVTITLIDDNSIAESNELIIKEPVYSIRIFNNQSMLLSTFTRSGKTFSIPLSNIDNGIYIIEISDGKNTYHQQLIINK